MLCLWKLIWVLFEYFIYQKFLTLVVADTGLNVDEVFFLDSHAEMEFELRQNKKREIEQFKQEVAQSVHVNEVSYFDTLREAKKKQKAQKTKKRSLVPTSTIGSKKQKTTAKSEASNPKKANPNENNQQEETKADKKAGKLKPDDQQEEAKMEQSGADIDDLLS